MNKTNELKTKLIKALRDLKSDKLSTESRKNAYAEVVDTSDKLSELDSSFKMDQKVLEKYKEFKSKEIVPRVVWPEYDVSEQFKELEEHFDHLTALALKIVQKRLPREPQDSEKFGMIVSATTGHLVALAKKH